MKAALVVLAGAVVCAVLTAAVRAPAPALAMRTVTIDARCAGTRSTQVSVSPWNVSVAQGDDIQWTINAAANTNAVTITPKASISWPFATNRASGTKATPAQSSGMRANARGRYSYTIQLICQAGSAAPDTVRVDPDVIVE